jgi:hypothetical protein
MAERTVFLSLAAELSQGVFILSLLLLVSWRLFNRRLTDQRWSSALDLCAWLGLIAAAIGLCSRLMWFVTIPDPDGIRPHHWSWWLPPVLHLVVIIVLSMAKNRRSWWIVWTMALLLMLGMSSVAFERFVIVITSLHRDYLPSSWTLFHHVWPFLLIPTAVLLSAVIAWWHQRRVRAAKSE